MSECSTQGSNCHRCVGLAVFMTTATNAVDADALVRACRFRLFQAELVFCSFCWASVLATILSPSTYDPKNSTTCIRFNCFAEVPLNHGLCVQYFF